MRHLIAFLFLALSCNQRTVDNEQTQTLDTVEKTVEILNTFDTLTLTQFENLFRHRELVSYDISTDTTLVSTLDYEQYLWSSKRILVNDTLVNLEIQGTPLSIRQLNQEIRRITTFTEGENQPKILVFTLNKNLKTLDRAVLTFSGGDEGISSKAFGKYLNDSLYRYKEQETEYDSDKIQHEHYYCLKFNSNGTIERIENCR